MRLADISWRTPPPTSVDEQLVLYDEGLACLVVRGPRDAGPAIGTYACRPGEADARELAASGPGPRVISLTAHEQPMESLFPVLDRVRELATETPEAIAIFHGRAVGRQDDGSFTLALLAVAAGTRPVEFELDPERCNVHFLAGDQAINWRPLPELQTGFINADAKGLGGLSRPAVIAPAAYGAISFAIETPEGADTLSIQVAGWLRAALPDEATPEPFEVRTEPAPLAV